MVAVSAVLSGFGPALASENVLAVVVLLLAVLVLLLAVLGLLLAALVLLLAVLGPLLAALVLLLRSLRLSCMDVNKKVRGLAPIEDSRQKRVRR